jgi:agmatinase
VPQKAKPDVTMWSGFLHSSILGTFLRQPHVPPQREALKKAGINAAFIGFPWDSMCISRTGTNLGPKALRAATDQFLLYNANTGMDLAEHFSFADVGDVPVVMGNAARTMDVAEALIGEVLAAGALPVTLGGDHSITIAAVRAFAKAIPKCGLILFDTHFDTALDVGGELLSHCCPITRAVDAGFDPKKIVIIGHSGWMNPRSELSYCREKGITLIPLEMVWDLGPAAVAERAVSVVSKGTDGVYLTLDIDTLDSSHAPGTGVPTPCGMTSREFLGIIKGLGPANVRAFDLVEVSPSWDNDGITSSLGVRIILDTLAMIAAARAKKA